MKLVLRFFCLFCLLPIISFGSVDFSYENFQTSEKMRFEAKTVLQRLAQLHYLQRPIQELDQTQFIEDYLQNLDRGRYNFTIQEVKDIQARFGDTIAYYIRQGNLFPAFEIFKQFHTNATKRYEWITQELQKDFDFSKNETISSDRADLPWPKSYEELNKDWRLRLQFELLNEILQKTVPVDEDDIPAETDIENQELAVQELTDEIIEEAKQTISKRYERWHKRLLEFEPTDVQEIYLTTLTQTYDPHSTFLSTDTLEDFNISMQNSLVGIGALLEDVDGKCVIKRLIPGGPAKASKQLQGGDVITAVAESKDDDFVEIYDMKLRNIVKLIRGKKGTVVRLKINPADADDPSVSKTITLVRDEIKLTANLAKAKIFPIQKDANSLAYTVGVIELPSFYGSERGKEGGTTHDVDLLISKLKEKGVDGIVLDLRYNGGGLLSEAVSLTGLFIESGPVVQIKDSRGSISRQSDTNDRISWDGPLIVLTSRHSASASEILAGALRDYNRAIIVGDSSTHGKGTVQQIIPLSASNSFLAQFKSIKEQYGAAKVTIQKFFLPSGASTQNKGVLSDIIVPSVNEYLPIGESDLDNPLPWDEINPSSDFTKIEITKEPGFISPGLKNKLIHNSAERLSSLKEFDYLRDSIEWWKLKDDEKSISLNYEIRKEQKISDREKRNKFEELKKSFEADKFSYEEVLLPAALVDKEEDTDEEDDFSLDIPLRESLRIMEDWLQESKEVAKL